MSLYDDASLILYPSGYKEDKIYSLKPTDGSGDLDFTRASSATRVNSDGLIETASVLGSEQVTNGDFSNSGTSWSVSGENATHIATFNGSTLRYQSDTTSPQLVVAQGSVLESGKIYKITIDVDTLTSGSLKSDSLGGLNITPSVGVSVLYATATGTTFNITRATTNVDITINSISIKEVITNNVPRIDYTSGCGKLLLEGQRTNLAKYSEDFSNAAWTKNNTLSRTANAATSPDGTTSADLIYANASSSNCSIFNAVTTTISTVYTSSLYVKASGKSWIFIRGVNDSNGAYFNTSTGVLGSVGAGVTATITSFGNGWHRCTVTQIASFTLSRLVVLTVDGNGSTSVTPSSTDGSLIWGATIEAGAYATSYIPTLASSSVTRLADAVSKTGISSLIGQTEGTVFLQFDNRLLTSYPNEYAFQIIGSGGHQLWLRKEVGGNYFTARLIVSSSTIWTSGSIPVPNGNTKIAISYKTGDSAIYLNGTQFGSTNTAAFSGSSFTDFYFNLSGTANPELKLQSAMLFPIRLTNTQLATLTTL
jgi:hypothetical protein